MSSLAAHSPDGKRYRRPEEILSAITAALEPTWDVDELDAGTLLATADGTQVRIEIETVDYGAVPYDDPAWSDPTRYRTIPVGDPTWPLSRRQLGEQLRRDESNRLTYDHCGD